MTEPTFEVEIRCDVPRRKITDAQFDKRTRDIVAVLDKHGRVQYRRVTHPMAFETMRLFLARVQADTWDTEAMFNLSEHLKQKWISVYSPSRREGAYIGPKAQERGEFEVRCFSRFDPEALRREEMAKPVDLVFESLMSSYEANAFTDEDRRHATERGYAAFRYLLRKRLLSDKPLPTVAECEGFVILALDFLEHTPERPPSPYGKGQF